jgi:hypothetical protein
MKLLKVGFFKEFPYSPKDEVSIFESRDKLDIMLAPLVATYLNSGVAVVVAPQITTDVFSTTLKPIGTLAYLTDGIWVWPSDLGYYVNCYKVNLPQVFLDHMRSNKWQVATVDVNALQL